MFLVFLFFFFCVSSSSSSSLSPRKILEERGIDTQKVNNGILQRREAGDSPFRIAFVFVGPLNDIGWSYQHNLGRIALEKKYSGKVVTEVFPEISSDYDFSLRFIGDLCASGRFDMVVGTSFLYQNPMFDLTDLFPSVFFLHIWGTRQGPANWAVAGGQRVYEVRYLTGLLAGLMGFHTQGVILSLPLPEINQAGNAIYKGMVDGISLSGSSVKPKLHSTWINTFVAPGLELYHAMILIDNFGVSLLHQYTDSLEPQFVAMNRKKFSIGSNVDAGAHVSPTVLVSAVHDWGVVYIHFVEKALNGEWTESLILPVRLGAGSDLSEYSVFVPDSVRAIVDQKFVEFQNGTFSMFCGEWIDPWWTGLKPPTANDCLSDNEISEMYSLHPDIEDHGFIPIPTTEKTLNSGMVIAVQVLVSISLGFLGLCAILIVAWRKKYYLHASSIPFLCLCLLGCTLLFTTVLLLSETPTSSLCSGVVWTLTLGSTLFFAPILAKTYRVNVVMKGANDQKYRVVKISNATLAITVLGCLLVDIILLICFQVFDSPETKQDFDDEDLDPFEYWVVCSYPGVSSSLLYATLGWKVLLLFIGCCLTFLVRSAHPIVNEARFLMLAIYDVAFTCAILIPLVFAIESVAARYLILSLGILFGTNFAAFVIFLPKFWYILTKDDECDADLPTTERR